MVIVPALIFVVGGHVVLVPGARVGGVEASDGIIIVAIEPLALPTASLVRVDRATERGCSGHRAWRLEYAGSSCEIQLRGDRAVVDKRSGHRRIWRGHRLSASKIALFFRSVGRSVGRSLSVLDFHSRCLRMLAVTVKTPKPAGGCCIKWLICCWSGCEKRERERERALQGVLVAKIPPSCRKAVS
jgi:hypothetical protein